MYRLTAAACLLGLSLALAFQVPGPAQAQSRKFDHSAIENLARRLFYAMDLDKNGSVSREEYEHSDGGGFNVDYSRLDGNGDGELSWDEYLGSVRHFHPAGPPKHAL